MTKSNCTFTLGVKQTWQLLSVQFDMVISISGMSFCQIEDIQSRIREIGDTQTEPPPLVWLLLQSPSPLFWIGEVGFESGKKVQETSLSSQVRLASWRLRHSLFSLDGLSAGGWGTDILLHRWWRGRAAWTPEVRQPRGARKCTWLHPTVPCGAPRCVRVCAYTYFFTLFTNALLYISVQLPPCLKVLPEVRAQEEREGAKER